jgi:putative transposase
MSNHYHLLLETPEANLARGMGWLQNAYTRRINTRHRLWGHLFGGRYKAILVEPGNCFWALLDYIHLNPVRAGLVHDRDGLEAFGWSSLAAYIGWPSKRPQWLETEMGFSVIGCKDNVGGRREFLGLLEKRVDWRKPSHVGLTETPLWPFTAHCAAVGCSVLRPFARERSKRGQSWFIDIEVKER